MPFLDYLSFNALYQNALLEMPFPQNALSEMPFQKCPIKNARYHDVLFENVLCNALSQFALYQTAIKQGRSIFIIHVISDCEISNA